MRHADTAAPPARDVGHAAPYHSVIIPVFDARRTVGASIRSVLAQTTSDFEIIVVDDGSSDGSADEVAAISDSRLRLIRQENRGLSAARNAGIALARGTLVSFLDSDDLWLPEYLARMGQALRERPEAALAYCDAWLFEDRDKRVHGATFMERTRGRAEMPSDPEDFFLIHLERNFFYVGTTVRRDVLLSVGPFHEGLSCLQDYELWLRIELSGRQVTEVPTPLALYRLSDTQISRNDLAIARDLVRMCDLLASRELPPRALPLLEARRRGAERDLRALSGESYLLRARRCLRVTLKKARLPIATRGPLKRPPPARVVEAFPDWGIESEAGDRRGPAAEPGPPRDLKTAR